MALAVLLKPARAEGVAATRPTIASTATAWRFDNRPGHQMASSMAASSTAGMTWTVTWWTASERRIRIAVPA